MTTRAPAPLISDDGWQTIERFVELLDACNGRSDHDTAIRVHKVTEEAGEVAAAYIGLTGQNPRKGRTHSARDVADELCDVVLAALVTMYSFVDDPRRVLAEKVAFVAARSGLAEQTAGADAPAARTSVPAAGKAASVPPSRADRARTAAIMRRIGQHRPAATPGKAFVCGPCAVAWAGAEADCWSCGRPATSQHGHHRSALQQLFTPAGTSPHPQPNGKIRAA
jgi:NTP pyrophosphatase (non-canonical NTP hydrolase)